jgi:hypothetical protein
MKTELIIQLSSQLIFHSHDRFQVDWQIDEAIS